MTFSFRVHQEGCTPFSPCKSCTVVSLLRSNLDKIQFTEFTATIERDDFSFTEHHAGCSPVTPCKNCEAMEWLRSTLSVERYGDLVFSIAGQRPGMDRRLVVILDTLNLSIRTANCLRNYNLKTVGELLQKTEAELLRIPNFGRRSLIEIREVLAGMGLHLGMNVT